MEKESVKVYVKLGGDEPSKEFLEKMIQDLNSSFLKCGMQDPLSCPELQGNGYVAVTYTRSVFHENDFFVQGVISGYLIANNFEVI
jgi:hypothetical protein